MIEFNDNVLLIANEGISHHNSNGRTVMMLLTLLKKEHLFQFYIHDDPEEDALNKSFCVTDSEALTSFLPFLARGQKGTGSKKQPISTRNCRRLFLRNFVWNTRSWWKKDFDVFLKNVSPRIILLNAGDAPFMLNLAIKVKKRTNAKLIVFTTENYVLKNKLYNSAKTYSFWHLLFRHSLRKSYKRIIRNSDGFVFNSEFLKDSFLRKYPKIKNAIFLMNSSDLKTINYKKSESFTISYLGNTGVGRIDCLNELASLIDDLGLGIRFIICGEISRQEYKSTIVSHKCVEYLGKVSYGEVAQIMAQSTMILHCENSSRLDNLRTAFSTKIADILTIGVPFFVYASREYPFVQYLEKNKAAHIASNISEARELLTRCYHDYEFLTGHLKEALSLANKNHNVINNSTKMLSFMKECVANK